MCGVDAVELLVSKVDALSQWFDWLGIPSLGSSFGVMFEVGAICEICGIQGHVSPSVILLSRVLSMPMLCKTLIHPQKTTPTQTHTTPIGEIIPISPTAITTHYHIMPLNLNP